MLVGLAWLLGSGCSTKPEQKTETELSAGTAILTADPLPPRREVVAHAHALVAEAERESSASSNEKRLVAAKLFERAFRLYGEGEDGEAAANSYLRAAGENPSDDVSCDSRVRAVLLKAEVQRKPTLIVDEVDRISKGHDAGGNGMCMKQFAPLVEKAKLLRDNTPSEVGLAHVTGVEAWPGADASRLVIAASRAVPYSVRDGIDGERKYVEIEIEGATLDRIPPLLQVGGVVSHVTVGFERGALRIRAYLPGQGFRRAFHLPEPFRIVLDIARQLPGKHAPRSVSRIALDAGHGWSDPGAIGPSGVREKDVTLDIVHRLAPILAKSGIGVVLTRDGDETVSLEERTGRVNSSQADLFVSIHCNASEKAESHGVETYVLDRDRDVVASRVAARENGASVAATREVGTILANLKLDGESKHATHFADLLQRSVLTSMRLGAVNVRDGGVKQAGFYVLVGARMPSVLFETSYISNPEEESRLASPDFRQRIADGIANAIRAYKEGR